MNKTLNSCYLYAPILGFAVYFRVWTEGDPRFFVLLLVHLFSVPFSRNIFHFIAIPCVNASPTENDKRRNTQHERARM